jgi:hypothetical protein
MERDFVSILRTARHGTARVIVVVVVVVVVIGRRGLCCLLMYSHA